MNSSDVKWVQGAIVLYIDPAAVVDTTKLVRDTDYVLLQMMGRIAHKCALLPLVPKTLPTQIAHWPNYKKGWPFQR